MMELKYIVIIAFFLLLIGCTSQESGKEIQLEKITPEPIPSVNQTSPNKTQSTPTTTLSFSSIIEPEESSDVENGGFPLLANLWGLYRGGNETIIGDNFDLILPYTFKDAQNTANEIFTINPKAIILHTQFATKGRPDADELFNSWWQSKPGDLGYACFFRDSKGKILLNSGWQQPMVNLINPYCRDLIVNKNLEEFAAASNNNAGTPIFNGIYWDLLFGKISWLGEDIDSNVDGSPDDLVQLDQEYKASVLTFLQEIRKSLPNAILMGNEAVIDYSPLINGRLFEWQLQSYQDGLQLNSWESIINDYREWTVTGIKPRTTIIENAPDEALIKKYGFNNLDKIPDALLVEASTSYQQMRFGLASALMGNGYYSFDLGQMDHGQFWWYDEYGTMNSGNEGSQATLPPQGYLGQPTSKPFIIQSKINAKETPTEISDQTSTPESQNMTSDVWAREFEHGIAVVNPTSEPRVVTLPQSYCKLTGNQAPLFQVRVDDDQAQVLGSWQVTPATWNQFGDTVHIFNSADTGTITYTPNLIYAGRYEVFAWVEPLKSLSTKVPFTIKQSFGESQIILDETIGEVGWHSLGTFTFDSGTTGNVVISASPDEQIVADAIKWVSVDRFNDGSKVDSMIVQPDDGIILIDCGLE